MVVVPCLALIALVALWVTILVESHSIQTHTTHPLTHMQYTHNGARIRCLKSSGWRCRFQWLISINKEAVPCLCMFYFTPKIPGQSTAPELGENPTVTRNMTDEWWCQSHAAPPWQIEKSRPSVRQARFIFKLINLNKIFWPSLWERAAWQLHMLRVEGEMERRMERGMKLGGEEALLVRTACSKSTWASACDVWVCRCVYSCVCVFVCVCVR